MGPEECCVAFKVAVDGVAELAGEGGEGWGGGHCRGVGGLEGGDGDGVGDVGM